MPRLLLVAVILVIGGATAWFTLDYYDGTTVNDSATGSVVPNSRQSGESHASKEQTHSVIEAFRGGHLTFKQAIEQLKETEPNRSKRQDLLAVLAITFGEIEPSTAIESVLAHYGGEAQAQRMAISNILTRLRRRDLSKAAKLVKGLPPSSWRSKEIADIVGEWSTAELSKFREWATSFELDEDREGAYGRFAQEVSKDSIDQVENAIIDIDAPMFTNAVITLKAKRMAQDDPHGALAWIDKHEIHSKGPVVQAWASAAPEDAAAYVAELDDLAEIRNLGRVVTNEYSRIDPQGASEWAAGVGDRLGDHNLVKGVVYSWMHNDSVSASKWVHDLNAGAAKDHAILAMVRYLDGKEPNTIEAWIDQIGDPEMRAELRSENP